MTGGPGYRGDAEWNRSTSCRQAESGDYCPANIHRVARSSITFSLAKVRCVDPFTSSALRAGPPSCRTGSLSIGGEHDGQLLKTTERGGARGFDAHKPVKDANATSWSTHSTYWASSFACSRGFSIAAPCTQGIRNRFLCLFQTFSPGVLYERAALDRD